MERYSSYKATSMQWLKEIPSHWEEKRMKYCFSERSEKNHPNEPVLCATQSQGVIPQSMYANRVVVVNKGFEGLKLVKEGDFVISLRSFEGGIEYAYYQGIISAAYTVLQPNNPQSSNYWKYLFKSQSYIQLLQTCVTGIREGQNINYPMLSRAFIPLPPLAEQEKIVSYLDSKTSKIDAYVADKEKEIQLLQELKQKTIAEAVTKGLNPDAKMKDSGISWIGMIPEQWETKRIASLFTGKVKANTDFEYHHAFKFYYGTLVPKDETGNVEEYRDTYVKYSVLQKDDIMINGLNLNYDFISQRVAIAPSDGIITSAYVVARPRKGTNAQYYNYLFKTMDNMKLFHGMGTGIRLTLSFDELKKQLVVVPPQDEQQAIVSHIEEKCQKIDTLITELQAEINYLKEYKQRLIADVVTGQVNVQNETI